MNDQQENHLTMYHVVIDCIEEHADLMAATPALLLAFNNFKMLVAKINETTTTQVIKTTGYTQDKLNAKKQLASEATIVAKLICAYAYSINDLVLSGNAKYTYNKLMKFRDEVMPGHCQIIYNLAQEHLAALADYGITAAVMASLQAAMNNYRERKNLWTLANIDRNVTTAELKQLFKDTNLFLRVRLDSGMMVFKLSAPKFYRMYVRSRNIIDL